MESKADTFSKRATRRMGWLTLAIGFAAAGIVAVLGHGRWGVGLAAGTILAWLNHRWLVRMVDALVELSTAQADRPRPQVPVSTYLLMAGRYFLLVVAAYAIVTIWAVPVSSILTGLLALGAAVITESLYEVFAHPR